LTASNTTVKDAAANSQPMNRTKNDVKDGSGIIHPSIIPAKKKTQFTVHSNYKQVYFFNQNMPELYKKALNF
jgi:hypothetical protein